MQKTYSETFTVRATECDFLGRMRPEALFCAMQEGGERHAIRLGAGYDDMMARGMFFVLSRVHVSYSRQPRIGERVVHTTWPGVSNRFFCPRYHVFTLEDGTPLASAGALWVILDIQNRQVVSPLKADLHFPDNSDIPAPLNVNVRPAPVGEERQTLQRTPVYTEYDVNGHVNNTRYIAWLCDAIGIPAMQEYAVSDIVASYEKEIRDPQPLTLSLSRQDESCSFSVVSDGVRRFAASCTLTPYTKP